MRKIGFILLMMLLPLQSAWAAVHLYHSHGSSSSLVEVVFHDHFDKAHNHAHDHEHSHDEHAHEQNNSPDQSNAVEHHHHLHVHTVSVLTEVTIPDFPPPSAVLHSNIPAWQQTLFSQRIDRPNWR